jgi:hypothetical protein
MLTYLRSSSLPAIAVLGLLLLGSCDNPKTGSLFDPSAGSPRPQPALTSVSPSTALAGTSILTITGTNFSTVKEENVVYFNTTSAQVLTASATQLTVLAPNVALDSIKIRVQVFGADLFSNFLLCKLDAAVSTFGNLATLEEPSGIATDAAGNLYTSLTSSGAGFGVKKITPDGVRSDFAPAGGVTIWSSMKVGPGGVLFAARTQRALFTITQGASSSIWAQVVGSSMYDFDFDKNGNIWVVGNNSRDRKSVV